MFRFHSIPKPSIDHRADSSGNRNYYSISNQIRQKLRFKCNPSHFDKGNNKNIVPLDCSFSHSVPKQPSLTIELTAPEPKSNYYFINNQIWQKLPLRSKCTNSDFDKGNSEPLVFFFFLSFTHRSTRWRTHGTSAGLRHPSYWFLGGRRDADCIFLHDSSFFQEKNFSFKKISGNRRNREENYPFQKIVGEMEKKSFYRF